jgi:soluble lytic murein transglycosylase-like protein
MSAARRPPVLLLAACLTAVAAPALAQGTTPPNLLLFALPGGGIAAFERPAPAPDPVAASGAPTPISPQPPQPLMALQIPSPPILRFNGHEPRPKTPYGDLIYKTARRHSLSPRVVAAVIEAESDFQPKAKSRAGAYGLMQLLPETARRFGLMKKRDLFNPAKNVEAGVRYLRWLTERFGGDLARVVAAYNAGEGAVDRFGGVPPFEETQTYLRRIYGTLGLSSLISAILPPTPQAVFPIASAPAVPTGLTEGGH